MTATRNTRTSDWTATQRQLISWTLIAVLVLGWWMFLRPSSMGGPLTIITVTGESMEPGMHTGDVAVMFERDSYDLGDVVAFRANAAPGQDRGAYVIHRVAGGSAADGYVMRGDNNDWDDPWTPTADEVAGEMLFMVPQAGTAMRWISQPFHLAAAMAAVMAGMVAAGSDRDEDEDDVVGDVAAELVSAP